MHRVSRHLRILLVIPIQKTWVKTKRSKKSLIRQKKKAMNSKVRKNSEKNKRQLKKQLKKLQESAKRSWI